MFHKLTTFLADISGATGIEYGLLIGSVGVTVGTCSFMLGNDISDVFDSLSAYLNAEVTEIN